MRSLVEAALRRQWKPSVDEVRAVIDGGQPLARIGADIVVLTDSAGEGRRDLW